MKIVRSFEDCGLLMKLLLLKHQKQNKRTNGWIFWYVIKGCICYILLVLLCLKESTCETRKNVFYFTSKALFVIEIIKF